MTRALAQKGAGGAEVLNPIALGLMVLGILLLLFGSSWAVRRSKATGVAIMLLGVILAAIPFLVSWFLSR
jgi:hypothetical protein